MLKGDEKISLEYILVQAWNPKDLEQFIADRFAKGWGLQGGVSISPFGEGHFYVQAMTKRFKPEHHQCMTDF